MRRVFIESPYAGNTAENERYLRAAMRDCLDRGEAPFASHGLYTQDGVLDDGVPSERAAGMAAGSLWRECADVVAVYEDMGISNGMREGIAHAHRLGVVVEYRRIGAT